MLCTLDLGRKPSAGITQIQQPGYRPVKKSKGRNQKYKKLSTARRKTNKQILPALAAVSSACGLATAPASALELGQIRVDSALGQPLRASIAYALAPNEQMYGFCIFLKPGSSVNGVPVVSNVRVTITDNAIVLNGRIPIKEPLLAMQLSVNCPYTAQLARDYTLMIDPPLKTEGQVAALSTDVPRMTVQEWSVTETAVPASDTPTPALAPVSTTPRPRRTTRRPQDESPIAPRSRYLVQAGDSLSEIVARIEDRSIALWPAVNAIFAANPHAFLENDPNLLKAGSWLDIPDLSEQAAVTTVVRNEPPRQTVTQPPPVTTYPGIAIPDAGPAASTATAPQQQPLPLPEPSTVPVADASRPDTLPQQPPAQTEPAGDAVAEESRLQPLPQGELFPETIEEPAIETIEEPAAPRLRPGDFVIGTDNPFVVPLGSDDAVIDIPDSELRGPQVAQPVPSVAVTSQDEGGISGGWAWLFWLGGAGIAMILGLILFGRQLREYFGVVPVAVPAVPQRRRDDAQPATIADIDYNFDATTITGRKLTLDADLGDGTGLLDSDEMDVAQDFAFSATESQVDMEIPEAAAREEEPDTTEVIAPKMRMTDTIVEDEILPEADDEYEDDEDYSVSMNVDATKQILEEITATTKDLQAVLVDTTTEIPSDETGEYTLSRSAEYQILEQDYEEEMSATQALNKEIEEAARALAQQMDETYSDEDTKGLPAARDPEVTAELTANLETHGDAENDAIAASGAHTDVMVEMPVSDGDETLEVESPLIESEKKEASGS